MTWLTPSNEQPMPLSTDLRELLLNVEVSQVNLEHAAIDEFLAACREIYQNGGAFFGCFTVTTNPTLDWLLSRNKVEIALDRAPLLQSDAVFNAFPELGKDPRVRAEPKWEGMSDLTFSGELAHSLRFGGAYRSIPTSRAIMLADNLRQCLFQDRYDDICVLRSFTPWNSWFWDIAWDQTWFLLDKRMQRFYLLLLTDTD
jgi:hypothetical protein